MPDKKFVHVSKSKNVFEFASGSPPHEALVQPIGLNSKVLRDDFLIGKSPVVISNMQHLLKKRLRRASIINLDQ